MYNVELYETSIMRGLADSSRVHTMHLALIRYVITLSQPTFSVLFHRGGVVATLV